MMPYETFAAIVRSYGLTATECVPGHWQARTTFGGVLNFYPQTGAVSINGNAKPLSARAGGTRDLHAITQELIAAGPNKPPAPPASGDSFDKVLRAMCAVDVTDEEVVLQLQAMGFGRKGASIGQLAEAESRVREVKARAIMDRARAWKGGPQR